MSGLAGVWDVTVRTPIGSIAAVYTFTGTDADVAGTATANGDTVPLLDIRLDGAQVAWRQRITRPIRLNLDFAVTVDGDSLTGHSRAGRLPRSAVSGTRRH